MNSMCTCTFKPSCSFYTLHLYNGLPTWKKIVTFSKILRLHFSFAVSWRRLKHTFSVLTQLLLQLNYEFIWLFRAHGCVSEIWIILQKSNQNLEKNHVFFSHAISVHVLKVGHLFLEFYSFTSSNLSLSPSISQNMEEGREKGRAKKFSVVTRTQWNFQHMITQ